MIEYTDQGLMVVMYNSAFLYSICIRVLAASTHTLILIAFKLHFIKFTQF